MTVELEFDGAKVRRTAFHRSVIRSDERLDYPRVDRIFAGAEQAPRPVGAAAGGGAQGGAGARRTRARSAARWPSSPASRSSGSPATGHVESLLPSEQTESHRLIEFLMIAANEAVASLLEKRKLPALYRVHEPPDPPRVERLIEQLESLDVPTPPLPGHMTAAQAGELVSAAAHDVDREVRRRGHGRAAFTSLVLRSLKQAHYTPRNLGHYGLRSTRYCHFTSPIRRYPDLICHRALLSAIGAGEATRARLGPGGRGRVVLARERDAMAIERTADNVARAFLLERRAVRERLGRASSSGEVTGVIGAGAFIAFDGYEGLLGVRRLRGDWWELNELETMLVGADSDERIRLGDAVRVQVEKVDAAARPRRPPAGRALAQTRAEVGDQRVPDVVVAVLVPEVEELALLGAADQRDGLRRERGVLAQTGQVGGERHQTLLRLSRRAAERVGHQLGGHEGLATGARVEVIVLAGGVPERDRHRLQLRLLLEVTEPIGGRVVL